MIFSSPTYYKLVYNVCTYSTNWYRMCTTNWYTLYVHTAQEWYWNLIAVRWIKALQPPSRASNLLEAKIVESHIIPPSILSIHDLPLIVQVTLAPVAFLACTEFIYRVDSTMFSQLLLQLFHRAGRALLDDTWCVWVAPIAKADQDRFAISDLQAQFSQLFLAENVSLEFLTSKFSFLEEPQQFVKARQKENNVALKSHHITCLLPGRIPHSVSYLIDTF